MLAVGETATAAPVALLLQLYVVAPDAVRVAVEPVHKLLVPVMATVGFGFTVTLLMNEAEQTPFIPTTE